MTLTEQANVTKWGPTVEKPRSPQEALDYAINVLGDRDRLASLGEVYAIKGLLWLREQMAAVAQR